MINIHGIGVQIRRPILIVEIHDPFCNNSGKFTDKTTITYRLNQQLFLFIYPSIFAFHLFLKLIDVICKDFVYHSNLRKLQTRGALATRT